MSSSQENGLGLFKILLAVVRKKDDYFRSVAMINNAGKAKSVAMANKEDEARSSVVTKKEDNRQRRGMRLGLW